MSEEVKTTTEETKEASEIMEEVEKEPTVGANEVTNSIKPEDDSLKLFEDRKFYKPTQIASELSISSMTVIRSLDRNKVPYLSDPSQKKKIRLYRGSDLNSFYVLSKND